MERVDRISLLFLVSPILLLAGMALAIPAEPSEFESICRSRSGGAAEKPVSDPATPGSTRLKARSTS